MMLRSISRFVLVNQRHANLALKRSVHQNHVMNTLVKRLGDFKWSSSSSSSSLMMITRGIKTTSKKDETYVEVFDPEYINEKKPKGPETAEEFADVSSQKNWISFGYDEVDQKEDRHLANAYFFSYFTLGCLVFSWIIYYYPYIDGYDWAQREAFIEVNRREQLGLPFIDPNLVDPEKITLPSEEELKKLNLEIHL
ncbi:NADH dehydrogenase 1 beta subcomplex subunit 11 ndufb11 [Dermatophagoides farinae]|uniref:NADH dehydrogenase [ubiquinone] 1 beta subcomplex subunit 11, mitochondrial n=1 Tax=Dermatophagoides farinae TaxID=6954 RepID=A0A922HWX9_DERFA|nr:NADH dehydrogenase 1 beta subcomplex subunit 11 ndufb11 [Dermatophagoides farinae]